MSSFQNKVALITGSSQGIGKAIAIELAQHGCLVILNGRQQEKLDSLKQDIENSGGQAYAIAADVSNFNEAQRLISQSISRAGKLDILINNVGISSRGNIAELNENVIEQVFKSNVNGCIFPTQAALPQIRQNKGSIVFISSLAAIHGLPGLAPYSASKMALQAFAEALRIEEHDHHIHVGLLRVAKTAIEHQKQTVGANGQMQVLKARNNEKVLTMAQVAKDCLRLIEKRQFTNTQTLLGKINRILNSISPLLVEKILIKNIHRFKEESQ
ncbi:MAG: SDR family oxidoreductase [Flavobacteriales bacterium]